MKNDLEQTLINIGLNENEAKVYLASISLGPTTILKIAKKSDLKRTTVYSVVEELKRKGLMRIDLNGLKQLYSPEDPKKLDLILKERERKFSDILPEFEALYKYKDSGSNIRYYEGFEAIKGIYNMLVDDIKKGEDYLVISDQEKGYKQDPEFFQDFMERRAKKPINIRMLLRDSAITREHKKFSKNYALNIKILNRESKLNTDIVITPQHLLIQQMTDEVVALVIDNPPIIETHKELFELLWKTIPE